MFDRTKDGRILQRNFGGHRYPRLAHVGDRTGLEMIRTLQDHGIHQGIDVHMECTVVQLLKDGDRVVGAFGYERERGRFMVFKAKAVVLATGGIGRAYKITSNSWEYTGDGHTLAYDAGAELIDMEFVQFHPTGMVWPPSVRGILVTEGVRGEGGVLRNKDGRRFMFDDIPDNYKDADRRRRRGGLALHAGRQDGAPAAGAADARPRRAAASSARSRPGAAARTAACSWILPGSRSRLPNAAEHIKKKLPSMYHQFKQLADIDITHEPMEVGPTTHYVMGGVRVDAETQMSTVPGLFAAGECAAGHERSESAGRQFALGPAGVRQARRRVRGEVRQTRTATAGSTPVRSDEAAQRALEPFERGRRARTRSQIQNDLQEMMQDLVGIVRTEAEMRRALDGLAALPRTRPERRRRRAPGIQPRMAYGTRPPQSADGVGGNHPLRDRTHGESRRPFSRRLPRQGPGLWCVQPRRPSWTRRNDGARARADPRDAARAQNGHRDHEIAQQQRSHAEQCDFPGVAR